MTLKEAMYQEIEVSPKKPITNLEIKNLLQLARRTRSYVKFIVNKKYYIMVTFHRNGKVNLQSNIKVSQKFSRDIFYMENRGYIEGTWAEFIRIWINDFAKTLNQKGF